MATTEDIRSHVQHALGNSYTLERELGGGGMARVFVAEEVALGRRVVVKILAPAAAESLSAERFAREVKLAARLQHPNIVPLFAAGVAAGTPYYTMPYVEGETLRSLLDRQGAIATTDALAILRDVARALASAHEQGIVHRDVKPENILISRDAALVADFGIAKAIDAARTDSNATDLTQAGIAIGTPAYIAPEQAAGELDVDHRADLYALGVVAYEMLAGRHPFAGKRTAQALVFAHLIEAPPPLDVAKPGLSPGLVALVTRCLAKSPADRPSTARELGDLLATTKSVNASLGLTVRPLAPSIAVLPFVNLSADPDNEYFSDGISEEVLSVLARDSSLRVAARSSSFAFKGQRVELRRIAERLHVNTLLEGSVRRVGNRVRITAQLVNAADGYQLWSDRFDREVTDIFAVQDEIANAIAQTLRQRLRPTVDGSSPSETANEPGRRTRPPVGVEAYDEYLKGLHASRRIDGPGYDAASDHFRRALVLEPRFAAAHAGLGETLLRLGQFFAFPPTEAFAGVRRHALRALDLEPNLADAHWLLAEVALFHDWDVEISEAHLRRALALEPHHSGALMTTALCHNARHRRQEAIAVAARAVQVDPLGMGTRFLFMAIAFNLREHELVVSEATRLVGDYPQYAEAFRWRALGRMMMGELDRARADLETSRELGTASAWWCANAALLASQENRPLEVARMREELIRLSDRGWVPPTALGLVEQSLGNDDAAFAWYERAFQARDFTMAVFHTDPIFAVTPIGKTTSIADDERWARLVQRVGLSP